MEAAEAGGGRGRRGRGARPLPSPRPRRGRPRTGRRRAEAALGVDRARGRQSRGRPGRAGRGAPSRREEPSPRPAPRTRLGRGGRSRPRGHPQRAPQACGARCELPALSGADGISVDNRARGLSGAGGYAWRTCVPSSLHIAGFALPPAVDPQPVAPVRLPRLNGRHGRRPASRCRRSGAPAPARPAAEPRGRGVGARRDAALARRDRRRHRDPHAGDFYRESHGDDLPRLPRALPAGRAGRRDHARRRARGARRARAASAGKARIHELAALVPATANAAHYARIVREMATLRGLVRAGTEIARLGQDRPGETTDLVDRAEQIVFDLAQQRVTGDFAHIETLLKESFERIMQLYEAGADVTGHPDRLPRARQAHVRLPAGQPDHHRGAARRWGSRRSRSAWPRTSPSGTRSRSRCSRSRCRRPR